MRECPTCHFLVAADAAGCAFCGRALDDHGPGVALELLSPDAALLAFAEHEFAVGRPASVSAGTAVATLATAPGGAFPPPFPLPWGGEPTGTIAPRTPGPGGRTVTGVTVRTGASNLVITMCFVVGVTLFSLGVFLFAMLG